MCIRDRDTTVADIPVETEDIKAESDYVLPDQVNSATPAAPQPVPNTPTAKKPTANKEAQKPKAVLPKKKG
jgi:hypothetical protein